MSNAFFNHYLGYVTAGYFDDTDCHPDDISGYDDCIMQMKQLALAHRELDVLQLVFDYYLAHPEISLENHGGRYPFEDEEVREILRYARSVIWPDNPPVDQQALKNLTFVPITFMEWRQKRRSNQVL